MLQTRGDKNRRRATKSGGAKNIRRWAGMFVIVVRLCVAVCCDVPSGNNMTGRAANGGQGSPGHQNGRNERKYVRANINNVMK